VVAGPPQPVWSPLTRTGVPMEPQPGRVCDHLDLMGVAMRPTPLLY
jgi:hypothetical protein